MKSIARSLVLFGLVSCTPATTPPPGSPASAHGKLSELSRVEGQVVLCDHKVPESVCTKHHPGLIPQFKRVADWCEVHGVPESQCLECHPDLTFEPLPELPPDADVSWLAKAGEDVPNLDSLAVRGKVTIFDFSADWCAVCRKVDGHLFKRIAGGDKSFAFRRLNIVDWDTPLSQRYLREVPTLPLLIVYGTDGKRVAQLHGADLAGLDKAIMDGTKR